MGNLRKCHCRKAYIVQTRSMDSRYSHCCNLKVNKNKLKYINTIKMYIATIFMQDITFKDTIAIITKNDNHQTIIHIIY